MKILVIDSQGGEGMSAAYLSQMKHVRVRGVEMDATLGQPCHPHGLMTGYLAASLLHPVHGVKPGDAELVFVRIFDQRANSVADASKWMLDVISREKPDYVGRSWGGVYTQPRMGSLMWGQWVFDYRALQRELGFLDFGSAGNSGNWLPDSSISFPQVLMPDICNVIGSCRRDGLPSEFTSSGQGVQCLAWGEKLFLNNNGTLEVGSGTSFSAPKVLSLCAVQRITALQDWRDYVRRNATKPVGFEAAESPVWGAGNIEDEYQRKFSLIPIGDRVGNLSMRPTWLRRQWFDFAEVPA